MTTTLDDYVGPDPINQDHLAEIIAAAMNAAFIEGACVEFGV